MKARTIGAAEIIVGRNRITPATEVMFAVAIYLCIRCSERVTREELASLFWPDSDEVKARHNLRQILYRLRSLGFATTDDGSLIGVDPSTVSCDLGNALDDGWPANASADEVLAAAEFLPRFEPKLSTTFSEWLDATRARLAAQFRRAALRQLDSARLEGRWEDLERWADTVLRTDPLNEEGTLAKAEAVAMTGSKALAVEILDRYVDELGDRSKAITLPAKVLRRRISERALDWGSRGNNEVVLVGRETIMRRLTSLVDAAKSANGGSILLYGAPGIGKTRLSLEARNYATLKGFRTISVRADDARSSRPLGLITEIAPYLIELPGAAAMPPAAMTALRRLTDANPTDVELGSGQPPHFPLDLLSWALAEAIRAAGSECCIFLQLDDLHNADPASLTALAQLALGQARNPIALVCTARSHWVAEYEEHDKSWSHVPRLHVPAMSQGESNSLAAAVSRALPKPLTDDEQEEVARTGGGNPLFIRELATHRFGSAPLERRTLTLASVIEQRCARLRPRELRLLRAVSVLGRLASLPRLRALLLTEPGILADEIERLERDGLLHWDGSGILALHECWRDAIEADTSPAARAALALECAIQLGQDSGQAQALEIEWHRGHLYALAACRTEALDCYTRAGDRLLSMGVPAQACEAYTLALGFAAEAGESARVCVRLGTAQHAASMYAAAAETCRQALRLLSHSSAGYAVQRAEVLPILAEAEWKAYNSALDTLGALADIATDKSVPPQQRNACCYAGIRISCCHDGRLARHFADAAVIDGGSLTDNWMALCTHLIYQAEFGHPEEVRRLVDTLGADSLSRLPVHSRITLQRHRATALRFLGDFAAASHIAIDAAGLALSAGHLSSAVNTAINLAFGYLDHDSPTDAKKWIDSARAWSSPVEHDERERSLRHVVGRYLLAVSSDEECLAHYSPHLEAIRADAMGHRRAVDSVCLALAAARTGDHLLAREVLPLATDQLRIASPAFNLDFAAEASTEVLELIESKAAARAFRDDYIERRGRSFQRTIAPAFRRLLDG